MRVRVEASIRRGTPMVRIVGMPPGAALQCVERIRAAAGRAGLTIPGLRITVNLAPADLPKSGAAFDLPILIAVLAAAGHVPVEALTGLAAIGELGLDGGIRPVRGVLPVTLRCAADAAVHSLIVPQANLREAATADDVVVRGAVSLTQVIAYLSGGPDLPRTSPSPHRGGSNGRPSEPDLAEVQGQVVARRVLEIAAAGGHHVLLLGEPGVGKTMLARRLPGLLPPLTPEEAVEASIVHSVAGLLDPADGLLAVRPFRAPHHLVTAVGLVGGGSQLRPGEASLAHRGVLFLDELGEFRPGVLDALRQPLETGTMRLVRATGAVTLPAAFQLVAAMNGCPCGYVTSGASSCVCSEWQIRRYFRTVSGPLLDRIDMIHEMAGGEWTALDGSPGESSATVARRVAAARRFRLARGQPEPNAALDLTRQRLYCRPDDEGAVLLVQAARQSRLSMRVCHRVLRVARTIADLAESAAVRAPHVLEALAHRRRAGEFRPAG